MIKNFYIGNFKAFGKTQKIPIKPITLIFGPNSSGKSSILQSLLFAQHINNTNNFDVHKINLDGKPTGIDLGGHSNYVHQHNLDNIITFDFEVLIKKTPLEDYFKDSSTIKIKIDFRMTQKGHVEIQKYTITDDHLQAIEFSKDTNKTYLVDSGGKTDKMRKNKDWLECKSVTKNFLLNGIKHLKTYGDGPKMSKNEKINIRTKILCREKFLNKIHKTLKHIKINTNHILSNNYAMDDTWKLKYFNESDANQKYILYATNNFLEFILKVTNNIIYPKIINNIKYLGPLRCYPDRRIFSSQNQNSKNLSTGEDAWDILLSNEDVRKKLNDDWMEKIFNGTYEFKVRNFTEVDKKGDILINGNMLNELHLYDKKWDVELSHRDVGFGISQVLPVLVTSLTSYNKTVLIEQPELHLHPALQAVLGDLFIESALSNKGENNNTFLLETHSEHLILRIMRRIREYYHYYDQKKYEEKTGRPPIISDDVAVLYVERQGDQSVVKEIPITPDGEFAIPWPDGFFTERAKELF